MKWTRLGRGLVLVLLPVAVFLLLGEITLRLYLTQRIFYDVEMSRYAQLLKVESPNPLIGHVHRPNTSARLMGVDVDINSVGLRDDEPRAEGAGLRRVVFLGDSLTFGWGVEEDRSFAHLLEVSLGEAGPTEVLNFGTGNYNTTQEVELFLERGRDFRPEQVVVFYFINDAEPVPAKSSLSFLARFRIVTFYWSRLKQLAARFFPTQTFREYYANLYEPDQPGWQETRAAFRRLAEVCRADGVDLRVVLLPELHALDEYPFDREYRAVAEFLRDEGIPVLDVTESFSDVTDPQSLWVSLDDAHPNAEAHRRIAEASRSFISAGAGAR
jgi:lysophospholipase L1-like esterase